MRGLLVIMVAYLLETSKLVALELVLFGGTGPQGDSVILCRPNFQYNKFVSIISFPTGHLVSRRWGIVLWASVVCTALQVLATLLYPAIGIPYHQSHTGIWLTDRLAGVSLLWAGDCFPGVGAGDYW